MISSSTSPLVQSRKTKNLKNLQLNLTTSISNNSTHNNNNNNNNNNDNNSIHSSNCIDRIENLSNNQLSTQQNIDSDSISNDSWSSIQSIKSPIPIQNRASTPTSIPLPMIRSPSISKSGTPKLSSFYKKIPSLNSISPSTGKRSPNNLALNIPSNEIGNDNDNHDNFLVSNIVSINAKYGDYFVGNNQNIKIHEMSNNKVIKVIPNLPFDKPKRFVDDANNYNFPNPIIDLVNTTPPPPLTSEISSSPLISSSPMSPSISAPINLSTTLTKSHNKSYSSEIKPQTIMHSFTESNSDLENFKFAYPHGPICVLKPNLFLYSEPTLDEITDFDVIINVAHEIKDFSNQVKQINLNPNNKKIIDYYFIPWTHTSKLTTDFPFLTNLIESSLKNNKKVLIHCQCGVSRSASLIMAYFMKIFGDGYNEAYSRLKEIVPQISPNLSLIYELIEWGEWLSSDKSSL